MVVNRPLLIKGEVHAPQKSKPPGGPSCDILRLGPGGSDRSKLHVKCGCPAEKSRFSSRVPGRWCHASGSHELVRLSTPFGRSGQRGGPSCSSAILEEHGSVWRRKWGVVLGKPTNYSISTARIHWNIYIYIILELIDTLIESIR